MATTPNADESADAAQTLPETATDTPAARLNPVLFLGLAVGAGIAFFGISQAVFPVFRVPNELLVPMPPPEIAIAREAALSETRTLNAALGLAILGLLMGGLLGTGEAAARRFRRGPFVPVVLAILAGAVIGGLAGLLGQFAMEQLRTVDSLPPIARTTLAQAGTLAIFGLGVGMAAGFGAGGVRQIARYAVAGAFSGILAGLLFPVIAAFVMHRVRVEGIIVPGGSLGSRPEPQGFALWIGCLVAAFGLLVPMVTREKAPTA